MKILLGLSLLVAASASADSYYSRALNEEQGISTLRAQLNLIGYDYSIGKMMHTWIQKSEKENHLCQEYTEEQPQLNLMCVRHDLLLLTSRAFQAKKIDEVEAANLNLYLNKLTVKKGEMTFLTIKPSLVSRLFNRKKKKVAVPMLAEYETTANALRKKRVAAGQPADLDPETLTLLKKLYRRKMFSLGRVSPDQYLVSKYTIGQIGKMSELMEEVTEWTDNQVSGQIVMDRVGLNEKKKQLSELQESFVKSVSKGVSAEELTKTSEAIEALKKEIASTDTQAQIDALNEERYQLALHGADEDRLAELAEQIEDLEMKLEKEVIIVPLDGENLKRLAMNHLEAQINTLQKTNPSMKEFDGNLADILVAGYLTGAVDGGSLKALLSYEDFVEKHESILLKAGKFVWTAGRMYLMLNPYTVIPTTLVSVVVSAVQKKKEYEKEQAKKTFLIRQ